MEWNPEDIEQFRKTHKLTRKALGQLLGVTVMAIYHWERGLRTPSKPTKILLSRIEEELEQRKEAGKKHGHKRNL